MVSRISDPRLTLAEPETRLQLDLLLASHELRDLDFMFDELSHVQSDTWRIQISSNQAIRFEWIEKFGAFNIRLE